ncbi:hypothetical protein OH76DRAFT_157787 [Lentinus brumalis]|uniref:Uncharacterized protein n=1 Tax=Lentinus brumalis TaxID=2498619 RepID=A0A371DIS8_9APHY|nr:hypothetical protein OH76DRAFT_157787 [Polyporus brumalis]
MDHTANRALLAELPHGACEVAKPPRRTSGRVSSTTKCHHLITTDPIHPLKTSISSGRFPDDLLVYGDVGSTVHYSRVYPVLPRDSTGFPHGKRGRMRKSFPASSRNVAHLYLTSAVTLDAGPQTTVLRAPLSLPHRASGGSLATVVVKLAQNLCGAHQRLTEEAELFNAVSPVLGEEPPHGRPDNPQELEVERADIPTFYGFYLPVRKDGSMRFRAHDECCDEGCECEVRWMTPILLLEESAETVVAE